MDSNRKKRASAWFYQTVYRDEQIRLHGEISFEAVPEEIRTMRALEKAPDAWRFSREAVFARQAELMATYEEHYDYHRDVVRYYPTYQSLTDRELRGYFSWRTKWRAGEREKTNLSYAFLYIYELLNQIGVRDPVDGFEKLRAFEKEYAALDDGISGYLKRWLWDYVIYYRLDPVLLADRPELAFDQSLDVLRRPDDHSDAELFQAVLELSSYRIDRSKLYAAEPELFEKTAARVLRNMDAYYASHRKQSFTEDYFGAQIYAPVEMFQGAVFYVRPQRQSFDYVVDALRSYQCREGKWTVRQPDTAAVRSKKLGDLMHCVDSLLREETGVGNSIQTALSTKWILNLIREAITDCLREREEEAARRITIDYSKLSGIRMDASVTRDRLIVDEEEEEERLETNEIDSAKDSEETDSPLDTTEKRLLRSLLYGGDLSWIHEEGLLLSVLVDSINDKLFEAFGDTVLQYDSSPDVIEDYAEELKEMVKP